MISVETTIEELYRLGLISVRAMNVCRSGGIKNLVQLLRTDKPHLLQIRNCGRKTFVELDEFKERYNHCLQDSTPQNVEGQPLIIEETELIDAKKKIELLPPNTVVQLKGWITWKFDDLSVRAKNAFPQLSQILSVIDAIYSTQKFNAIDAKNIGKKTSGEIQSFLSEVKAHFEDVTKEIDHNADIPKHNEFDRLVAQLGDLYPFLLTKECEKVATNISTHGIIPILFITKQYIIRSEDSRMNIYRDYYGFNLEGRRYSLSEIGERNNLSRERIRQLVSKKNKLTQKYRRRLSPLPHSSYGKYHSV